MSSEDAPALDRMLAAQAGAPAIAREIMALARAGLEPFCDLPEGYRHCRLDHTLRDLDNLRPGTFLTTNLTAEELGAGDKAVAQRLLSRCSENFIKFNFAGCSDWRLDVKARRIKLVEKAIRERLRQQAAAAPGGLRSP